MEVVCILQRTGQIISGLTKAATSPKSTISVKSYLCIEKDGEYLVVDAHAFNISGHAPSPISTATWSTYIAALEPVVDNYTVSDVPCPNHVKDSAGKIIEPEFPSRYRRPIVLHGDITDYFEYTVDGNDLEVHLTSSRLRHPNINSRYTDFTQMVPLINGCACTYTVDVTDPDDVFMVIHNGAVMLRGSHRNSYNIQFLDFSDMCDIDIVEVGNGLSVSESNSIITLSFDTPSVLTNKSFILFLMGRPVFCDGKYVIDNEDGTVSIDPIHLQFGYTILAHTKARWGYETNSIMIDGPTTVAEIAALLESEDYPSFAVILNTKRVCATYTQSVTNPSDKLLIYPKNTTGLLVDRMTGLVYDYISTQYDTDTIVSVDIEGLVELHNADGDNHMHKTGFQRVPRWFYPQERTGCHEFAMVEIASALE
jgi:hypothetical protein